MVTQIDNFSYIFFDFLALVVWCHVELQYFATQLIKHYLTKGSQLEDIAKIVEGVRKPCSQLKDIGLDVSYHMEGLLRGTLEHLLEESRYRLVDSIARTEKVWTPYNLQTKSHLRSILQDLEAIGIDMKEQITGDTWINLTQSTVNFCRHFMYVTESCAELARNESLKYIVEVLLKDLFVAQYSVKPNSNVAVDVSLAFHVVYRKLYLSIIAGAKFIEYRSNPQNDHLENVLELLSFPLILLIILVCKYDNCSIIKNLLFSI